MSVLLMTMAGQAIAPGSMITAVRGPHQGRHFRFVDVHDDGEQLVVHHMYPHPFRHARAVVHPHVFGLQLKEELTRLGHALNVTHHVWQRIDEWLLAGAFALIPLGIVEPEIGHRLLTLIGMGGE